MPNAPGNAWVTRREVESLRLDEIAYPGRRRTTNFAGISKIGQAFADELFRVFANAHPHIRITPANTEPAVAQMVQRAVAARSAQAGGESAQ